jgi:hypothetical protein
MTTTTQWGKDTTQTATQRNTEQQQAALWSKISTLMKNGLLLKNAAQIFRATAENWVSSTRRATHTAHSEHSKRFYALFLRFANSNTAGQHNKQRVGLFTASCLRYQCGILTTATQHTAINMYEQKIRKNCSNRVSR